MIVRVLPLAAMLLLAGCGGSKLDGDSIAKLIVPELADRGYGDATLDCPDVDNKVGTKFTCEISDAPPLTKVEGSVASDDQINLDRVS
ncbi:MAG: hypothetical protein ACJ762_06770 [Solirubrobacteraceae bacterium]